MPRAITRDELEEMVLEPKQIEEILEMQRRRRGRKYRYVIMLTEQETKVLFNQTGRVFIRASEWRKKK